MMHIDLATFLVNDYDEAIDFFVKKLRFILDVNQEMGEGKQWVVVRPAAGKMGLLLAKASDNGQRAAVGNQHGGRVGFFLNVQNFNEQYDHMADEGVNFMENIRHEPFGTVVVFEDLYGNLWDLIGPAK
ncbi:extradiol dioxygenase [Sphingorhabdus lutea]|uniref:Extradiol dioxygenase n=1 Tax=Sphingorhabdus lutea TaxID=1913578 RepID=A0A1L3JD99_9SPHN|nr:VOC family protein [Sphingorhabdus lutea]APG63104.1 extradiol dioxygenase [Sphingorhabdus lutea]